MERMVFGLIGHPLGHSLSQKFFTEKFRREGINAEYRMWDLPQLCGREDLPDAVGLRGFNVTIPYKRRILPMLDAVDDVAAAIGAVNVVKVREEDGVRKLTGYNSDAPGFRQSLVDMPGFSADDHPRALVLGTGGASKAIVYALRSLGIEPTLVSRREAPGVITYADLDAEVMATHTLIVNCTPLGTFPDTEAAPPIPYDLVGGSHFCHDLVYNPSETLFMRLCGERKAMVKNGAEMLRNQALEAWRIWTGDNR